MSTKLWMLPDGMEESLPPVSWQLEDLRRKLLDYYRKVGYELILPPFLEYLDTLLTGAGQDLDRQTFKLTDPLSGRLLGLRADMTPQAARIATRRYADSATVRLCYIGTVLRVQPGELGGARSPRQVGCEIFGEADLKADLEILQLMLKTLELAKLKNAHIDLGHVGIYRAMAARLKLDAEDESSLFEILQRKSLPDLKDFAVARKLPSRVVEPLAALMALNGDVTVLKIARKILATTGDAVMEAIDSVEKIALQLQRQFSKLPIHIDLAELRGYRYQTGIVFAAFVPGHGREVARGGRYDGVGSEFGISKPATGFSADVNDLLRLGGLVAAPKAKSKR